MLKIISNKFIAVAQFSWVTSDTIADCEPAPSPVQQQGKAGVFETLSHWFCPPPLGGYWKSVTLPSLLLHHSNFYL